MLNLPERISGITHPLVREIFIKKEFGAQQKRADVLVIKTQEHDEEPLADYDSYDSYMVDLLTDLRDLQEQIRSKGRSFDRIDIRRH